MGKHMINVGISYDEVPESSRVYSAKILGVTTVILLVIIGIGLIQGWVE